MVLTDREAGFRKIISGYRARAKKRGLEWDLDPWDCKMLLASACWYCGSGPTRAWNRDGATVDTDYPDLFLANGIDRVDNTRGYTKDNTRTACWTCNAAKGSLPESSFFQWVSTVYQHLSSQGLL